MAKTTLFPFREQSSRRMYTKQKSGEVVSPLIWSPRGRPHILCILASIRLRVLPPLAGAQTETQKGLARISSFAHYWRQKQSRRYFQDKLRLDVSAPQCSARKR